ncbi:hypothetical protein GCM10011390_18820 [Aureimonas endophytica]|uniref:DUF3572 family protein n=1 Tax=Aureimonas endophytica TaxID=2027858 RepID=A0A916ZJG1_9HYPH|nr:DUF3572 family protein [Aureimonas endophytica]GGE00248.1 hypothetical protein GCM10011390_18820 [Aureimonas endophytica]
MIRDRDPVLDADEIGIQALMFVASHDDLMNRFLDLSGLQADGVRAAAADPSFFVSLLDFILAREEDVIDLASQLRVRPQLIGQARNVLAKATGLDLVDLPT